MFADDWIRTADLWHWKRPLYQLSHNHFPVFFSFVELQNRLREKVNGPPGQSDCYCSKMHDYILAGHG